jgi:quinolinate synthetase A
MNAQEMFTRLQAKLGTLAPEFELHYKAELAVEILELKQQRNAVILGHNYMEPALFHSIPDFTGDSLDLSRKAATTDKDVIVFAACALWQRLPKFSIRQKRCCCRRKRRDARSRQASQLKTFAP